MHRVNVNFLRAGQVVADTVTNERGAVLCPIGFTLTDKAIQRLKNAKVQFVQVESNSLDQVDLAAQRAALEKRFEGIEDPILLKIKAIVDHRYRIFAGQRGN